MGVILYELLALEQPFKASNMAALIVKICTVKQAELPAEYSAELRALVASMLQKRPEKRPTAEEILALPLMRRGEALLPAETRAVLAARPASGGPEGPLDADATQLMPGHPARRPADALDQFLARGRPPSGHERPPLATVASPDRGRPPLGARQRAPSASSAAEEFHRNREMAAQAKGRAEGDLFGRPAGAARSHSVDAAAYEPAAHARVPGSSPAKRAAEEEHLRALAEAAQQARADRRHVQQRVQETERASAYEPSRPSSGGHGGAEDRDGGASPAVRKSMAEADHLQALREAGAQARRERQQLKQKMLDLEQGSRGDAGYGGGGTSAAPPWQTCDEPSSGYVGSAARKEEAEAKHLQALTAAAAQARRDQRQLRQKMQELEQGPPAPASAQDGGDEDGGDDGGPRRPSTSKQEKEERHLLALQEAAAQARRDQKQLRQKMLELERDPPERAAEEDDLGPSAGRESDYPDTSVESGRSSRSRRSRDRRSRDEVAAERAEAEQRRLQELQNSEYSEYR